MANKKVSQLSSKPSVLVTDLFPIADPSTGQLYKTTISDLGTAIGSGVSSVNGLVGAVVLDTDDIQELVSPTNKWFTDTRARAALSASSPLTYNSGTGAFGIQVANGSQNGYLSSTDWTTFNGKQAALSGTGFVKISGTIISYDNSTYLTTSAAASTYVPYTGATSNLNMGTGVYGINAGQYLIFTKNGASGVGNSSYLAFLNAASTDGIYAQLNTSNGIGFYGMTSSVQTSQVAYITRAGDYGANSFIKIGGTSSQFLKADGSVDSSTYLTTGTASSTYMPLSGSAFTGTVTSNSFIITSSQFAVKKNSSGTSAAFYGLQNAAGTNRWNLSIDTAETGSGNTGFDFNIYRYDDAGSTLASAFSIRRSDGLITNTSSLTNLGDITIGNGTADKGLVLYANNGSSGWAGRILAVNSSGEIKVQHRNNSATYTDVFKFNANSASPTTEFFGKTILAQASINTSNTSSWLNVYDTGTKTNSIDLTASGNSTKGHIGQFNNKLYISSNWFYNGSQNADSTSFGQAAIVFDTQNAGGGTQLDFQTSEIGASVPVSRYRISVNGTSRYYLDQGSNNQFINLVGTQSGYSQEWGFGIVNSSKDFRLYDYTAGVERIRIQSGGNLIHKAYNVGEGMLWNYNGGATYGFYNNNAGALTLTNSGVANVGSFNMSTGIYTPTSDINKKKDFEESNIGLNEILNLKPTFYRMKTDDSEGMKELGFIAQEVKEFIPNAYVENDDFIGLNFNPIVAALTKAVQELEAKIKTLENK
jgi:hypothetical protein